MKIKNSYDSCYIYKVSCPLHNFFLEKLGQRSGKFAITPRDTMVKYPPHPSGIRLTSKDNIDLTKKLNEGFKRSVYWNDYKSKIKSKNLDNNNPTRFYLDASYQEAKTLYV